ncbi:MAG: hypothetical protein P4L36_07185 [Holophaga sp.]|nr:hypothetical protein [Holophaga sp.]
MSNPLPVHRQPRRGWFHLLALAGCLLGLAGCGGHHEASPASRDVRGETRRETDRGRPGSLSGRLTDRATGLALAGAAIHAQDTRRPRILAKAVTAADGSYTLTQLPLGVPFRVVTQPITGALAYGAEMSQPVTLVQGTPAPAVDLACAQVAHAGSVEIARRPGQGRATEIALVQSRDIGGGNTLKLVIRTANSGEDGALRVESVPPGSYEVHFLTRDRPGSHPHRPPHQPRPGHPRPGHPRPDHPGPDPRQRPRPNVEITVQAATTCHVNWPARLLSGNPATDEVEDLEEGEPGSD